MITQEGPAPVEVRRTTRNWERPALAVLLLATAVAYIWGLSASGWANSFYSAAVQAGSESWQAFFYGSSDAAGLITVDKPPASLWVMALSVRAFGLSSWSILVPQALMGVATVGVVHAAVRRRSTSAAALIAGAAMALTPVAALMFRFNNPDALLVLLLTVAAYAVLRAVERAGTAWLVLAGACFGLAFLTKTLQAFLILPGFAIIYLIVAPTRLRRRLGQLALAGLTMLVTGGWWVAIVELVPASARPYIGGSQSNSFLELTFGYNGLGRINGEETGSVGGGGGWGETGIGRLFDAEIGGQIAWLIPAALIALAAGLWLGRKAARTDPARAAYLVWGSWLVSTGLTFSLMAGIFHAYYTVALAPAIAALTGMGAYRLWRVRRHIIGAVLLAVTTAVTAGWSFVLLTRSADFLPWLRWAVLAGGAVAAVGFLPRGRLPATVTRATAILAVVVALAGPAAYTVDTIATAHTGSIVTAGPSTGGGGMPGGGPGGNRGGNPGGAPPGGGNGNGGNPMGARGGGDGGPPAGGSPGNTGTNGGGRPGGMNGLLNGTAASDELVALLQADAGSYDWAAATVGSQNAAGYQLASREPVMALGGFNGSDPAPTLAQFQRYVADGRVHYFIAGGGGMGGGSGESTTGQIADWVAANYAAVTVDGVTVYDLTA
ncbi:ArnT family glycosyltransferase [Phytomonospora endophytica]|uniref:4-amino-4-deoxy-L-arabinose transferase-like glycosyltransferase n=1 Tax=Phytomonospora endophytica TaxID=714109 RepID=A0A841FA97_9ACTN|nr:glycosyltransferase family 39 protein [Phytomonospora endophytica]MBB6032674.1 4-amino-4-deoxy-L-arabinose transferase-like glycosyltransferase [Phytomonospora endophytica]GIG66176.1 hypothetical protein Pen01_24710 [Phytomonospora endophytica]